MRFHRATTSLSLLSFALLALPQTNAAEPNETFANATVLEPGVLNISDELYPENPLFLAPDTYLGAFGGLFGGEVASDDDNSPLGDGFGSAIYQVPINSSGDQIDFAVTGTGDYDFFGDHGEEGSYEAFVYVFDFFDDLVDQFSVTGTLTPGSVDSYGFNDGSWFGGSYSIEIDNTAGSTNDVDFFTFTGLDVGASFSAETLSTGSIDTLLGWFDDNGNELAVDDDGGADVLSKLEGVVPASGQLTFAVTGYGDDFFEGSHNELDTYDLQLTLSGGDTPGDFDNDGDVDALDLTHPTLGWQARYGIDLDGADFLAWQRNYEGGQGTVAASTAVPEPGSGLLFLAALLAICSTRSRYCVCD